MTIAGTGHRPDKLGGYSEAAYRKLYLIALQWLEKHKPDRVISGMALGWDLALCEASIDCGIDTLAAVPFKGQELIWPKPTQQKYHHLINYCEVKIISEGEYQVWMLQVRNKWMVDHCDKVLAMYNGGATGGTANCIHYAKSKGKTIINLYNKLV